MKNVIVIAITFLITSCNSTDLVDYWKNPEIGIYKPNKILVIGITNNERARTLFEEEFVKAIEERGVEAHGSLEYNMFNVSEEKWSDDDLKALNNELMRDGYDTVIINKVIGVEDKIRYKENFEAYDNTFKKFKDDFLMYQDIYYNEDYYEEYSIYHALTTVYCICPEIDEKLIWKGFIDIYQPENIENAVQDYVQLITTVLQEDLVIPFIESEKTQEDFIR